MSSLDLYQTTQQPAVVLAKDSQSNATVNAQTRALQANEQVLVTSILLSVNKAVVNDVTAELQAAGVQYAPIEQPQGLYSPIHIVFPRPGVYLPQGQRGNVMVPALGAGVRCSAVLFGVIVTQPS